MDRPTLFSAQDLLEALLMPGFVDALNSVSPDDFDDFDGLRANLETQQTAFIAQAASGVEAALNRYIDRQLAAPMVPAVRGEDYDPHRLAAIFLDPATSEEELRVASLFGDRPGDEADADTIGTAPNLLAEYCHLLAGNDRAEALALLAVLVGDFDGWAQALAGEDLDTLQRDLKAQAEGERVRHIVKVRVPTGDWNEYAERATLDVEVSTVVAEGETVAEAIRFCQLGSPLLEFESPEPWSGPAPVRQVAAAPATVEQEYRDWRVRPTAKNAGYIVPNAIGAKFTPAQRASIVRLAQSLGFDARDEGPTKVRVIDNTTFRPIRELDDFGARGAKRMALVEKVEKREQEAAKREAETIDAATTAVSRPWIVSTFGEDALNAYNSKALSDYLEGRTPAFAGLMNWKWQDGLRSLGAVDAAGNVDFAKIRAAYLAEAEELAEELEPVRGDLDPYGDPKKSVDDRGMRAAEAQRALTGIDQGMTLLNGGWRRRKGADDTEGQWNAVVRAIRGSEATAAAYFYDYAPKGIPAYADRRAWWRWNDAKFSLPDDAPTPPFAGTLYYGAMPETEPPVREVAPGVTAYEFSRMQDDDAKRQAAASLVSQLSPRRAPVAEPAPVHPERERDIEAMLRKTFPPRKVKEVRLPELIDTFSGEVLVPARYGYVLEGSTGQTLADTAEEVEQKWDAIFAEKAEAERQRLLGLSDDSFKAQRAYLLGFYYLIEDYLEETYPGDPERQAQAREILTQRTEQREGRKKTDKTFRGTRAEVADQMLKAGYFTIIQKPPGGSKEVPLLKNWQGVFEVKPEVFQFAEWLQERRKRDERASQAEAAEAERRFRTGNPRRRPNPDIGTSMVYGYGINQMTPSAPMGASSAVRSARLAAEAERLAQRLARGRR